jgi:antitoxin component YwqK of YwqJK toxin-antitoxin module
VIGEQYQIDGYGIKNGFYKEYNQYGTIIRHFNYSEGKENGLCIEYITMRGGEYFECDGKPMVEKMMNKGDVVYEKEFACSNGGYYMFRKREANKDGVGFTYTEYYPSGKISKKYGLTYYLDKLGAYTDYYENGSIKEAGNYLKTENYNALMNGHFYAIGENKDTQYSVWFDKNYPVMGRFYYPNGKVKDFIKLSDDYQSQIVRHFDENGNLTRSSLFRAFEVDLKCGGGVLAKNRKDAMNIGDACLKDLYNPFDLDAEKNMNKDLIYLEIDSVFENSSLKSIEKFYPYSYKNDYGVIKRGGLPEKMKNEIDSQNNIIEMKNQFYRQTEAAVAYLKSKYVETIKGQYETFDKVKKKQIYNAFGAVYQDFIFGNMYVIKNEISRMTTTQSGLYAGKKVTHIFSIPSLYYTDYLMLYKNDSFNVYYKKLENLNTVVLPSNADLFEYDEKYGISGFTAGTEYEGTYYESGVYFKPQSVNKPWMTDIEQLNAAAEFFKAGKAAIDRLAAQEDTKDLEKQLKATKDPKELRKLLGM